MSMSTGQLHKLATGKHIAGPAQKAIADVLHIPRDELLPSANTTTADHRHSTRPTAHGNGNAPAPASKLQMDLRSDAAVAMPLPDVNMAQFGGVW
jgi:hypothetical protein